MAGVPAPAAPVEPRAVHAAVQAADSSQGGSILPSSPLRPIGESSGTQHRIIIDDRALAPAPPVPRSRADFLRAHVRYGTDAALLAGPVVGAENPDLQLAQRRAREADVKPHVCSSGADEREEVGREQKVDEDVIETLPPHFLLKTSWLTSMSDWDAPFPSKTMRRVADLLARCPELEPASFAFAECPFFVDGRLHSDFVSDMTRVSGGVAVSGAMSLFVHAVCVCASKSSSS